MFFARKVSVFTILSYVFSVGFVLAADTTVTSKQYVDNQLLKKINLETGAGISAGDMLRATVDTNDANKMKWLAWTPDYITNSVLTTRLADYQLKITSSNKLSADLVSGLHAVATSGNYNDLTNKPTIPTVPGVFTGATDSANGTSGLVKQPLIANRNQFLKGDGNWASVTKSDVGLGNVDNTSDADKPISTATQTALDAKQNKLPYSTQYVLLVAPTTDGGQVGTRTIARRGDEITGITGSTTNGALYIPTAYAVKEAIETATSGMVTDVPTASESTAGIAKLYTGTGSNTDGSMTQDAITSGLNAKVPTTRTVNGHALSSDITLSASDVGAQPAGSYASSSHNHDGTYVKTAQGATNSGKLLKVNASGNLELFTPSYATTGDLAAKVDTTVAGDANSLMIRNTSGAATKPTSSDVTVSGTTVTIANSAVTSAKIADGTIMNADVASNAAIAQSKIANLTGDLAAKVPTTRTVNGYALSSDITLSASDVGAASSSHDHDTVYVKKAQSTTNGILTTNNTGDVGVSATISQNQVTDLVDNLNALVDNLNAKLPKSSANVSFNYEGEYNETGGLLTEGTDVANNLKSIARQVTTNKTNITGLTTNTVNGAPLSNTATYYYGSGAGSAASAAKTVEISSITAAPTAGMAIVVNPATTTTASSLTLNLNSTGAKTVYLDGSAVNTAAKASKVWKAGVPSIFVYDGTYWVWVGNGANYQPASTSNYSMGNSSGTWTTLTTAQQNALNSGITSSKVSTYDGYATGKLDSTLTNQANKVLYTNSSGVVTPDAMKVPITDSSASGGWATMWID